MARTWFQLVGEDGNAVTSADAVFIDIEDVVSLRDAVFAKASRALPANVIAADLIVFNANGVALPNSWSSVKEYGNDGENALIVQVPKRAVAMDVRGNLNRVQVQFATGELNYLLNKDRAAYRLL